MRIEGARGVFPMVRQIVTRLVATRLALVGDAAHAFPPIGAQGLNLGLRDVKGLVEAAREAAAAGDDIGGAATLESYSRSRRPDIAMRTSAVDGLNRSLLAHFAPLDAARGLGLAALGAIGPLAPPSDARRNRADAGAMRRAVGPAERASASGQVDAGSPRPASISRAA